MNYLTRCWNGDESPVRAFWILYGVGSLLITGLVILPFWWLIPNFFDPQVAMNYVDLINVITMPYIIYCTIAIWRCGEKANKTIYGIKAILIITIVFGITSIYTVIRQIFG